MLSPTAYLLSPTAYLLSPTAYLLSPTAYLLSPTGHLLSPTGRSPESPGLLHLATERVWCRTGLEQGACQTPRTAQRGRLEWPGGALFLAALRVLSALEPSPRRAASNARTSLATPGSVESARTVSAHCAEPAPRVRPCCFIKR